MTSANSRRFNACHADATGPRAAYGPIAFSPIRDACTEHDAEREAHGRDNGDGLPHEAARHGAGRLCNHHSRYAQQIT